MTLVSKGPGAAARERLGHPVIDADGHIIEHRVALDAFLREEGLANGFAELATAFARPSSAEEAVRLRVIRSPWWALPAANTRDLASAIMPSLLYSRLDELGIDFAVLYPSVGVTFPHLGIEDHRRAACRALNNYLAEIFAGLEDRMTPAAVIPMYTPDEAIEELDHVVGTLGLKAVVIGSYAARVIEGDLPPGTDATWLDTFGLDSAYDYDPFWARCVQLGVSPATHSAGMGWGSRRSISSYMYNHIGHFAAAAEALAKSLFFGGVTYRFPGLRVAFLEAGSAWATGLYADLAGRWDKRNIDAIRRYDPALIDREELACLFTALRRRVSPLRSGGRDRPGSVRADRRVRRVLHHPAFRRPRSLCPELLLRRRGRRPADGTRLQHRPQPPRCPAPGDVQFRRGALGRPGHASGRGRCVRAPRWGSDGLCGVPGLYVRQRGAALRRVELPVLRRDLGRGRCRRPHPRRRRLAEVTPEPVPDGIDPHLDELAAT